MAEPIPSRLERADAFLDAYQARVRDRLRCRGIGCTGCCSGPIPVTDAEWTRIRPEVTWAQRNAARLVDPQDPAARCPLLDGKGRCTVYDVRPIVCRTFNSTAMPYRCDPLSGSPGPVPEAGSYAAMREAHRLAGLNPDTATALLGRLAALSEEDLRG